MPLSDAPEGTTAADVTGATDATPAAAAGRAPVPAVTRPWWATDPGIAGERFR
ncbi:hypothetical protein ACFYZH_20030 [Streptomyces abikoensis]|uniref:hypothetical protein n=1 Tax=Streptomyces abikoensis TaxID=97398 RepID=UPI0036C3A363